MSNYPKPALFNIVDSLILPFKLLIDFEVPFMAKFIPVLIFISYLIFPFDIISDLIPFVGTIDDLAILSTCGYLLIKLTPEKVLAKYINQQNKTEEIIIESQSDQQITKPKDSPKNNNRK